METLSPFFCYRAFLWCTGWYLAIVALVVLPVLYSGGGLVVRFVC